MTTARKDKNTASTTQFSSDSEDRFSSIDDIASRKLLPSLFRIVKPAKIKM